MNHTQKKSMNTLELNVDEFLRLYSIINIDLDHAREFLYSPRVKQKGFVFVDRRTVRKIYLAKNVMMTPKGLVYCLKFDHHGNVYELPTTYVDITQDSYSLTTTDWSFVHKKPNAVSFIGLKPFKQNETWDLEKSFVAQYPDSELYAFRLQDERIILNYALI